MNSTPAKKILISGASIAGPTLAYWLHRYGGFEVTIVERAEAVRGGGYVIDIRGTAMDVVARMGLEPALREAHVDTRCWSFLGRDGRVVGSLKQEEITGGVQGRDVELPRGKLTELLYAMTRDVVEYRFGDMITALADGPDGVDVTFRSGRTERFDLVVAADGLHSHTRELVFGPEEQFRRYLGFCFTGFTMPNRHGFSREAMIWTVPGRAATLYETSGTGSIGGLLIMRRPEPTRAELSDVAAQRRALVDAFAGDGWLVPEMIEAVQTADDIYFDAMMQIFMPSWSKGRVVVVGDAAYGPSFFSGQGTSIALVGAYVLAGELATHANHADAFRAYEATARGFIEANQAIAKEGGRIMVPGTPFKLWMRNVMLRLSPLLARLGLVSSGARNTTTALKIQDYEAGIRR